MTAVVGISPTQSCCLHLVSISTYGLFCCGDAIETQEYICLGSSAHHPRLSPLNLTLPRNICAFSHLHVDRHPRSAKIHFCSNPFRRPRTCDACHSISSATQFCPNHLHQTCLISTMAFWFRGTIRGPTTVVSTAALPPHTMSWSKLLRILVANRGQQRRRRPR